MTTTAEVVPQSAKSTVSKMASGVLERIQAFCASFIRSEETERAYVDVLVTQVDPDALASAAGMQALIESVYSYDVHVRIVFCGNVGHPQNRAIINRFDLLCVPIREVENLNPNLILVDSSSFDDARIPEKFRPINPKVVVDHHKLASSITDDPDRIIYMDSVGAASTLVANLLKEWGSEFSASLMTLLALGIYTDTKSLVGAGPQDREAYSYVTQSLEPSEMNQLINFDLPESYYVNLGRALGNINRRGGKLVANVGYIHSESGDDLSSIADHLIRMDGLSMAVVWGIVDSNKVRISVRNRNIAEPLDKFLKDRFGPTSGAKLTPDGRGEGGATISLGLGLWRDDNPEVLEATLNLIDLKIKTLIFSPPPANDKK